MIPLHPLDEQYFKDFPSPIMKMMQEKHFVHTNATIAFFGPMLYFLIRALRCEKVLEIGCAQGYSSLYMASAVKDNATRFQYREPMYYGIDIVDKGVAKNLDARGLPNNIQFYDSIGLHRESYGDAKFDLIFQDGAHDVEHVLHEMEILYPKLKGEGKGYWIFHDCYGPSEPAFLELKTLIKDKKYNFEYVRLDDEIYGMAILRKMEGYKESLHWAGEDHNK